MHFLALFGGATVEGPEGVLSGPAVQRHRLALLARLAASESRSVPREKLLALLWPERDDHRARNLLNQAVHAVRNALSEDVLVTQGRELRLDPRDRLRCDVIAFREAIDRDEPGRAVDLYAGPFMDGFFLPDAPPFQEWQAREREELRRAHTQVLERVARRAEAAGDWPGAVDRWRRLAAEDPYSARVRLGLMQALEIVGERAGALEEARSHARLLAEEFGAEPHPEVEALARRLRRAPSPMADRERGASPVFGAPSGSLRSVARHPLVARDRELKRLLSIWDATTGPRSHMAVIAGEPGIGKTRLAEEILARAGRRGIRTARTRSYEAEGSLSYAPVVEWLRSDALRPGLGDLDTAWLTEVSRLLPEVREERPELPLPEALTETGQRHRLFTGLARAVLARPDPLILLIDDLQWLHFLLRLPNDARLLVLGTVRPGEVEPDAALRRLLLDLKERGLATEVELGPLEREDTGALARYLADGELLSDAAAALHRESEGNPLFIVESVRAGRIDTLDSGSAARAGAPLPPRVRAVIRSRLAHLSGAARKVAGVAAVIGRDFDLDLLSRVSHADEDRLVEALDELWQRRIVGEHDADRFDFTHDKLREVAYADLAPVRRRVLHRRVAEALEIREVRAGDPPHARIAAHFERAGLPARAIPFYERAAEAAKELFANEEAIRLLRAALRLLASRPAGPDRDRRELRLRLGLLSPIRAVRGWSAPEAEEILSRAATQATELGDDVSLGNVLFSRVSYEFVRGRDLRGAVELATRARDHAVRLEDPWSRALSHHHLGSLLTLRGRFGRALECLDRGRDLYERCSDPGRDIRSFGLDFWVLDGTFRAHAMWHEGSIELAWQEIARAIRHADEVKHPFSRAMARSYAAVLHQFDRDPGLTRRRAEENLEVCREHDIPYYLAWGTILRGWARGAMGEPEAGAEEIRDGLRRMEDQDAGLRRPYYLGLLAETCAAAGRIEEALEITGDALALGERTGERWRDADLRRLRGTLLVTCGHPERGEEAFRRAMEVASGQGARTLELEGALALARLLRSRGETGAARELLESVCRDPDEDSHTDGVREARDLLRTLNRRAKRA